jgi:hypothetical protein
MNVSEKTETSRKPSAVDPGSTWGQPAMPYLGRRLDEALHRDDRRLAHLAALVAAQLGHHLGTDGS